MFVDNGDFLTMALDEHELFQEVVGRHQSMVTDWSRALKVREEH